MTSPMTSPMTSQRSLKIWTSKVTDNSVDQKGRNRELYFHREFLCAPSRLPPVHSCPGTSASEPLSTCLCGPCVIELPPDFLRGACGPHPVNAGRDIGCIKCFGGCCKILGCGEMRSTYDGKRPGQCEMINVISCQHVS